MRHNHPKNANRTDCKACLEAFRKGQEELRQKKMDDWFIKDQRRQMDKARDEAEALFLKNEPKTSPSLKLILTLLIAYTLYEIISL